MSNINQLQYGVTLCFITLIERCLGFKSGYIADYSRLADNSGHARHLRGGKWGSLPGVSRIRGHGNVTYLHSQQPNLLN